MTEQELNVEFSGKIPPVTIDGLTPSQPNKRIEKQALDKPKIIQKPFMLIGDDISNYDNHGVYEAIFFDGEPYFLRCFNADRSDNSTKLFSLEYSISSHEQSIDGVTKKVIYQPKVTSFEALPFEFMETDFRDIFQESAYFTPTTQQLFDRIFAIIKTYADIPLELVNLCSLLVLTSYEQQKFNWLPYLGIFGDTSSGKSVLTEVMSNLCYRCGYFTQTNSAGIYQYLSEYEGTIPSLAEDETQGFEKDDEKIRIYKSGNSKIGKVIRILQTPNGRKLLNFPTYCFKILAGEQIPTVKGLNERTLIINMSKGKPQKHWYARTDKDMKEIKTLKWDLLKWRMANYNSTYTYDIQATSRIEDNLKPLRSIAKGLSIEQDFEKWTKEIIQKSDSEKKATLEGCTVDAVYSVINRGLFDTEQVFQGQKVTKIYLNFDAIWEQLKNITLGTVVNDKLQTSDFNEITKNRIGRILTDIFGSKSISRVDANNVKVRGRSFEIQMLLRVISNYFTEEETEKIRLKIEQEITQSNANKTGQ